MNLVMLIVEALLLLDFSSELLDPHHSTLNPTYRLANVPRRKDYVPIVWHVCLLQGV